ncbi:DUF397 domain-containing protein [Embleya sp. NPDC059237]|uniref:DUF397 domain-containing protein n=1 Tax=Embleya sp. NPDC059237 TaxID=3346784 RepID=UPI0036B507D5
MSHAYVDDATELSGAPWRTSSYTGNNSQCVEVARLPTPSIAVRDSKVPSGPALTFVPSAFAACIAAIA